MPNLASHRAHLSTVSLVLFLSSVLLVQGCVSPPPQIADLTIVNARLVTEPGADPIDDAYVSINNGKITEISSGIPPTSNKTLDANGRLVTAGLWNSHVHFTSPELKHSAEQTIRDTFLKYGFTSVIDTGSVIEDTLALKLSIDSGETPGPRILVASGSFVFTDGTPSYLPGIQLPEVSLPQQAEPMVAYFLEAGAQGIKMFSGSFQAERDTIYLPPEIIRAISDAAHARGAFVYSHPTDRQGLVNAVENGVDVLAHTAPPAGPLGADLIAAMKSNNVALVPTLKLWAFEFDRAGAPTEVALAYQNQGVRQLAEFYQAQGEILFGTDVGYMDDYDTREEFLMMGKAGMGFDDILASLTTTPSRRFVNEPGTVAVGARADLVIFESDPTLDTANFSRVAVTIKEGRVLHQGKP